MSAAGSSYPSRLALMRSTAVGALIKLITPLGQVGAGERVRQQLAQMARTAAGVDQQPAAAGLEQQLPAPAAGNQRGAVAGHHADRDQPARAGRVQGAD